MAKYRTNAESRDGSRLDEQIRAVAADARWAIGIDPSSTCTGLSLIEIESERVIEAVRARPVEADATLRIREMAEEVAGWLSELEVPGFNDAPCDPSFVWAIEIPSANTSAKTKAQSGGYGLTTYARAAGRIEALAERRAFSPDWVMAVSERVWTAGSKKERRMTHVESLVPSYNPSKDRGGDISDAICLGWWLAQRIKTARMEISR